MPKNKTQTKKTSAKKRKKKGLISQPDEGKIYIQSTFNNTIVTLTDGGGNVLGWKSAGSLGFKGTRKSTPYAATLVAKTMVEQIKDIGIPKLRVFVSGVGSGRDSAVRTLVTAGLPIVSIADITPIPHNGCRPKKPRRV